MAGLGYKDFANGSMADASEADGYFMQQAIMRFANASARDAALAAILASGLHAYTADTDTLWRYDGGAWVTVDRPWVQGTPTWAQANGTVLSIGNGALLMRYKWAGSGAVMMKLRLTRGSTSNSGSDTYKWTLPAGWPTPAEFHETGTGAVYAATGVTYPCSAYFISTDTFVLVYNNKTTLDRVGNASSANQPGGVAWATGDVIVANLAFEV